MPRRPGLDDNGEWVDPNGRSYRLMTAQLQPAAARQLAADGAAVVHDSCGCGGRQCALDWLNASEVAELARTIPVLDRPRRGWGCLEEWRSPSGAILIVAAIDVIWGDRIRN